MPIEEKQFAAALDGIARLREQGVVHVLASAPFGPLTVNIVIPSNDPMVTEVTTELVIPENALRRAASEISNLLSTALRGGSAEDVVEKQASGEQGEAQAAEDVEVVRRKLQLVNERFDLEDLRRRQWVKRTSKNDMLFDAGWEVVTKHADNGAKPPEGGPLVAANILLTSGGLNDPVGVALGRGLSSLVMTMDEEDLDALIGTLRRAREAIQAAREVTPS